jgi:hypothetical protein
MTVTIKAHFDGKVIVPDEPVDLPVDQPLEVELRTPVDSRQASGGDLPSAEVIAERLARLRTGSGRIRGVTLPDEALRRENIYEERW